MVSFNFRIAFLAVTLAGNVATTHIKKHRFFSHRSQCRPRLESTTQPILPLAISPSTPEWSSSVSIHTQTSCHSDSESTTTTAIVKHTSQVQPTSTTKVATPLSTSLTHGASALTTTTAMVNHTSTVQPTSATTSLSTSITHTSASTTTTATVEGTSTVQPTSMTKVATSLSTSLTPNGVKAGIAGGDAYSYMKDHIGWWYDWSPNPSKPGKPIGVPMLWGDGTVDAQDKARLTAFEDLSTIPAYVLGYEEPDCVSGSGSADMSIHDGVSKWESLIAPLGKKGSKLGSPSMCKQADETWLAEFENQISTPWDFTAVHINKNSLAGAKKDIDHYMKYGKPIWVTEFACVDDSQGFIPCTDQVEIDNYINEIVPYMQENSNISAYAYSNGLGLGSVWPLMQGSSLSASGKTYLAAIEKYH